MSGTSARQSPRIEYRIPVQLAPHGTPFEPATMAGRSINLSEGGMAIGVPQPLDVGQQVVCHLLVEGRPATLNGQVTWAQNDATATDASARVGIRFQRLNSQQNHLLGHLLSSAAGPGVPISLRFEGMQSPVVARGVVGEDLIRLSAPLPILARRTRVDYRLSEEGPTFAGEVAACRIATRGRMPVLEVDLSIAAGDGPRLRRRTIYGTSTAHGQPSRDRHDTAPDPEGPRCDDTERTARPKFDPEQDTTPDPVPPIARHRPAAPEGEPRERRLMTGPYALPLARPGWGAVVAAAVTAAVGTWALLTL